MEKVNEVIPQTFGLISTSKINFLMDFLHFFLISSSKFTHWPKASTSGARTARIFFYVWMAEVFENSIKVSPQLAPLMGKKAPVDWKTQGDTLGFNFT